MSLCVTVLTNKWITISGDSRGIINENGKVYIASDSCKKIHKIGERIYYFTGKAQYSDYLVKLLEKAPWLTIQNISDLCIELERQYIELHEKRNEKLDKAGKNHDILLEMIIACVEDGKPTIYVLQDSNKYKPIKRIGEVCETLISSGWGSDEGAELVKKRLALIRKPNDTDLFEWYKEIYLNGNSVYVGGTMTLYKLNYDGKIKEFNFQIPDKIKYPRLENLQYDPLNGIKISKNENTSGDPNNPIWKDKFYVDTYGNVILDGIFKTGFSGTRIEIDGRGLISYGDSNQKEGFCIEAGDYGYSSLCIYDAFGHDVFKTYYDTLGKVYLGSYYDADLIVTVGGNLLFDVDGYVKPNSIWDCSNAGFIGFKD
ncbi:MAG: hypothetical protein GX154_13000 [Clostridiales bacterium]|nr:hypothetical protein [Clostridiales bacterium]